MRRIISLLLLIATIVVMPTMLTSCGDDEPDTTDTSVTPNSGDYDEEDKFTDLYGYWINTDNSGAISIEQYTNEQCKVVYYAFDNNNNKLYNFTSYLVVGGSITALVPTSNGAYYHSIKIQTSTPNRILFVKNYGQDELTSYLFNRISENEFFNYLQNGPSQEDQNGEQKIDPIGFVGSWYSPLGLSVDTYQSNGTGTRYFLTEAYGDTYSESYDFTWAYVDDIKLLRIYYTDRNYYANENVVSADFPDSFTTQRGKWTKCNTLPKEESNDDASKLYGTWVGKDFDETYTITFYSDGNAKEVWTDGYTSETTTGTYEFSNGKITSWVKYSILSNALGDCPWSVTFNSANSITLDSGLNKMTFTKK